MIGDCQSDHNFHLFAQHEIRTIYMIMDGLNHESINAIVENSLQHNGIVAVNNTDERHDHRIWKQYYISCVEALTPIDMIDLGYGIHDATCHCVWTGAFLFVAAVSGGDRHNVLHPYIFHRDKNDNDKIDIFSDSKATTSAGNTEHRPIHVLELGCGTGIGSIGIWMAFHDSNDTNITPVHITMTDADPEALKLCQTNCELNHIPSYSYDIDTLFWGEEIASTSRVALHLPYDVVFATDVLYDITLLLPLLQTAYNCLCQRGYFILAHVPRACYKSTHPAVSNFNEYIIHSAITDGGFLFERTIHPNECCHNDGIPLNESSFPKDALNSMSLQEMQDIGAAIFIFQKKETQ